MKGFYVSLAFDKFYLDSPPFNMGRFMYYPYLPSDKYPLSLCKQS